MNESRGSLSDDSCAPAQPATLHRRYRSFVKAAAERGFLPDGGLTPREQRDWLLQNGTLPAEQGQPLSRLVDLLERCVYGGSNDFRAIRDGLAICAAMATALPPRPPPKHVRKSSKLIRIALQALIVAILVTAAIPLASRLRVDDLVSISTADWTSSLANEATAVHSNTGGWETPLAKPTWRALAMSNVLGANNDAAVRQPQFDHDTGTDGWFPDAIDPFTPPMHWRHRLHVFTSVDQRYQFVPAQRTWRDAFAPAQAGTPRQVVAHVMLQAGTPVAIPISSPLAAVSEYTASPPTSVRFFKDAGDGLHAAGTVNQTVELQYTLIEREDYEAAPLPGVTFVPAPTSLPGSVLADAQEVIDAIGELPQPTYAATVRRLHSYFAGFSVAPISPDERKRSEFLTVALARKGVCRHRSEAFFITANAVGIPTRLVANQCHSFCEVQLPDGAWRRMEFRLGDEEGPPGRRFDPGAPEQSLVRYPSDPKMFLLTAWILPPVTVLALGLFFSGYARDAAGHLMRRGIAPIRAMRRARRDEAKPQQSPAVAGLINLIRQRLASALGVDPMREQVLHAALESADAPRMVRARINNIMRHCGVGSQPSLGDGAGVQRLYWDCYHVLAWLDRSRRA